MKERAALHFDIFILPRGWDGGKRPGKGKNDTARKVQGINCIFSLPQRSASQGKENKTVHRAKRRENMFYLNCIKIPFRSDREPRLVRGCPSDQAPLINIPALRSRSVSQERGNEGMLCASFAIFILPRGEPKKTGKRKK